MKKLNLNESFISRIWENPDYYKDLKTLYNEPVEVINTGEKNTDAGADFTNAKIKINGVLYSGDVEIHKTLKDWKTHKHKGDKKYNKVILHVVMWKSDTDAEKIYVQKKREIHTIILSDFLSKSIHSIWKDIINSPSGNFRHPDTKHYTILTSKVNSPFFLVPIAYRLSPIIYSFLKTLKPLPP